MPKQATEKKVNPYIVAITILLPAFMSMVASSATNVCQPHIAGYFGATPYEANSIITAYIISGGIMLPIFGHGFLKEKAGIFLTKFLQNAM